MPVTLRYADDNLPMAAVYATVEEAEAQAEIDVIAHGRTIRDIVDGEVDHAGRSGRDRSEGRESVRVKVLRSEEDLRSLNGRDRMDQWTGDPADFLRLENEKLRAELAELRRAK